MALQKKTNFGLTSRQTIGGSTMKDSTEQAHAVETQLSNVNYDSINTRLDSLSNKILSSGYRVNGKILVQLPFAASYQPRRLSAAPDTNQVAKEIVRDAFWALDTASRESLLRTENFIELRRFVFNKLRGFNRRIKKDSVGLIEYTASRNYKKVFNEEEFDLVEIEKPNYDWLHVELEKLKSKEGLVVEKHFFDRLSKTEIGIQLGVSRQAVMKIISKACRKLKKRLQSKFVLDESSLCLNHGQNELSYI